MGWEWRAFFKPHYLSADSPFLTEGRCPTAKDMPWEDNLFSQLDPGVPVFCGESDGLHDDKAFTSLYLVFPCSKESDHASREFVHSHGLKIRDVSDKKLKLELKVRLVKSPDGIELWKKVCQTSFKSPSPTTSPLSSSDAALHSLPITAETRLKQHASLFPQWEQLQSLLIPALGQHSAESILSKLSENWVENALVSVRKNRNFVVLNPPYISSPPSPVTSPSPASSSSSSSPNGALSPSASSPLSSVQVEQSYLLVTGTARPFICRSVNVEGYDEQSVMAAVRCLGLLSQDPSSELPRVCGFPEFLSWEANYEQQP